MVDIMVLDKEAVLKAMGKMPESTTPTQNAPPKQLTNVEAIVRQNSLAHADAICGQMPDDFRGYPRGEQWLKEYFDIAEKIERWVWRDPK
jgi:hypothetical protein